MSCHKLTTMKTHFFAQRVSLDTLISVSQHRLRIVFLVTSIKSVYNFSPSWSVRNNQVPEKQVFFLRIDHHQKKQVHFFCLNPFPLKLQPLFFEDIMMKPSTPLPVYDELCNITSTNNNATRSTTSTDDLMKQHSSVSDNSSNHVQLQLYHKQVCHTFNMDYNDSFVYSFQRTCKIHGYDFKYAVDLNSPYIDIYDTPRKCGVTSGNLCLFAFHTNTGYDVKTTPLSMLIHSTSMLNGSQDKKRELLRPQMDPTKRYKKMPLHLLVKELKATNK